MVVPVVEIMDLFDGMPSDQFPRTLYDSNPELNSGAAFYRGGTFLFPRYQYQYWMAHGGYPIGVEIIYKPEEW